MPLPSVDEFRLSNILASRVSAESEAVAQALLNVNSKYQADLRKEVRRALTIEQKIQYKNIQVAKLCHTIQKNLQQQKRRYERVLAKQLGGDTQDPMSLLASNTQRLLDLAVKTSSSVQSLSVRLSDADRKYGGLGYPDAAKYPKLARILEKLDFSEVDLSQMADSDVYSASLEEPCFVEDYVEDPHRREEMTTSKQKTALSNGNHLLESADGVLQGEPVTSIHRLTGEHSSPVESGDSLEISRNSSLQENQPSSQSSEGRNGGEELDTAEQRETGQKTGNNVLKMGQDHINIDGKAQLLAKHMEKLVNSNGYATAHGYSNGTANTLATTELHTSKGDNHQMSVDNTYEHKSDSDSDLSASAFERLIDMNVQKYREKQLRRQSLDLFPLSTTLPVRQGNPLRLLYSASQLENDADKLDHETLRSPFVLTKSVATVSETPLTSLHKKLRINALPMKYLLLRSCECRESLAHKALVASLSDEDLQSSESHSERTGNGNTNNGESEGDKYSNGNGDKLDGVPDGSAFSDINTPEEANSAANTGSTTKHTTIISAAIASSDSDLRWTSSSGSSTDSDADIQSNGYYLSLRKDLRSKRKRQNRPNLVFRSESSPTPKHQPSHRILRPKQSILKMQGKRIGISGPGGIGASSAGELVKSAGFSELMEMHVDTPYRASPRGSFVNGFSAVGVILPADEVDGDAEDNEEEEEEAEELRTVSKLRQLLI